MRSVEVTLAGRAYTITELPSRKNAEWRNSLQKPFGELVARLEGAADVELNKLNDIGALVRSVSGTLLGSVDIITGLLFAYSPELAKDREHIEANGYDSELLGAFTEVLKLAYPFGELASKALELAELGQKARPTGRK